VHPHELDVGDVGQDAQIGGVVEGVPVPDLDGGDAYQDDLLRSPGAYTE